MDYTDINGKPIDLQKKAMQHMKDMKKKKEEVEKTKTNQSKK